MSRSAALRTPALLAVRILAAGGDARLTGRLAEYAAGLEALVLEKDAALQATLTG